MLRQKIALDIPIIFHIILELLRDEPLRRRVQRGLNKGELVNSAARALFFGQRGELRDGAFQDQVHRASCLHLLIAAIAAWTTPYLEDAIAAVRADGIPVPEEYIAHISPIAWEHVLLLGQYIFRLGAGRPLGERRPLRTGRESEDAEADEASVISISRLASRSARFLIHIRQKWRRTQKS